jgi:putative methylase
MKEIGSKKALEVVLSKLSSFERGKVSAEQYSTPSSIAAEVVWKGALNGDIKGKVIADLGCGTGILGIGCLLLGCSKVFFVDNDDYAISKCKENMAKLESEGYELGEGEYVLSDVKDFDKMIDTVVMNPPFGTKKRGADREFLVKAFSISKVTYSFHKTSTNEYIMQLAKRNGFNILERFDFQFMLRNTMKSHVKKKVYIDVSAFCFSSVGM